MGLEPRYLHLGWLLQQAAEPLHHSDLLLLLYVIGLQNATPSSGTGPSSAYQGRYYMYTEASDLAVGETNMLTTHLLYNSGKSMTICHSL